MKGSSSILLGWKLWSKGLAQAPPLMDSMGLGECEVQAAVHLLRRGRDRPGRAAPRPEEASRVGEAPRRGRCGSELIQGEGLPTETTRLVRDPVLCGQGHWLGLRCDCVNQRCFVVY